MSHRLRCYDYIDQPYARVRDALRKEAAAIFRRATASAVERSDAIGAQLRVQIGMLNVASDVSVEIGEPREFLLEQIESATDFPLAWQSKTKPGSFPTMHGALRVFALSSTETQIELNGTYDPPLGKLGVALDAVLGHRIAEAAVHNFLKDLVVCLRSELARAPAGRAEAKT